MKYEHIDYGEERLLYPQFLKTYQVFRISDIGTTFKKIPGNIQLPVDSILHLLDNSLKLTLNEEISDTPDMDNIFIKNENLPKFVYHHVSHTEGPIVVPKDYIYREVGLFRNLNEFRQKYAGKFRFEKDIKMFLRKTRFLGIINHNPMYRTFTRGALHFFRTFNAIWASMLNLTCMIPDKHHYFYIPMEPKIYPKSNFIQIFNKISPASVVDKTSQQYLLLASLFIYLNEAAITSSIFDQVPEEMVNTLNFIFSCNDHYFIINLADMKNLNKKNIVLNKIINQFNLFITKSIEKDKKIEIEEKEDATIEDENNVESKIVEHFNTLVKKEDEVSIEVDESSDDENTSTNKKDIEELNDVVKTIHTFTNSIDTNFKIDDSSFSQIYDGVIHIDEDLDDDVNDIKETTMEDINSDKDELSSHVGKENLALDGKSIQKLGEKYIDKIGRELEYKLKVDNTLTPRQKERAIYLAKKSFEVELDGELIGDILTKEVSPAVDNEGIPSIDPLLIDKSMSKSNTFSFDQSYLKGMYKRHIASIAISLTNQGMILTDIQTKEIINQLDQLKQYTFKYTTPTGKSHSVTFQLPIVRDDGSCSINGVKAYLKKQLCNKPICKVSPTRVSLSSNYNKTIVERKVSVAHSILSYINKLIFNINKEKPNTVKIHYGKIKDLHDSNYPHDLAMIGNTYSAIEINYDQGANINLYIYPKLIKKYTEIYKMDFEYKGLYIGSKTKSKVDSKDKYNGSLDYFMTKDSSIIATNKRYSKVEGYPSTVFKTSIIDLLYQSIDLDVGTQLSEWVDIKILDKKFPVIFVLAFRYGLSEILKYLKVNYKTIQKRTKIVVYSKNKEEINTKYIRKYTDVIIKFKDLDLVIPRYPLLQSLIIAGLCSYDLSSYLFEEFDSKDVYYTLLGQKHNYLRGIENFFNLFIDPITFEVLEQMGEPTNPRDLLIRATDMLTTSHFKEASSIEHHRLRGYERFPAIVYNEISREFANFQRKKGEGSVFSINPKSVLLRIIQDQAMMNNEDVNPLFDLKNKAGITYTGVGGRTSEAFVTNDRRYPQDAVGIISENTVDSSNVAISAVLSTDAQLANVYGFSKRKDKRELHPTEILSPVTMFLPGTTQDDPKRVLFASTQMSHALATKEGNVLNIRTGYEKIVGQKCSDLYCYSASEDGVVLDIDEDIKMVTIQYKSGKKCTFSYDTQFGVCAELVSTQVQALNIKKGDRFKKDDILRYNPQFFEVDFEDPKHVVYRHGLTTTVVLMDTSTTFEDSVVHTEELGKRLEIQPVVTRLINISSKSIIHEMRYVGDEVEINTPLMVFEDSESFDASQMNVDEASLRYLEKMNRSAPKAKFSGTIVKIDIYYGKNISEMHPTLASTIRKVNKQKQHEADYSKNTNSKYEFIQPKEIALGSKFKGIDITEDTVIFYYYIQENLESGVGDKLVIDSSLKCVTSKVLKHTPRTYTNNTPIDMIFSVSSIAKRIVNSPIITGIAQSILEKTEKNIVDMYFKGTESFNGDILSSSESLKGETTMDDFTLKKMDKDMLKKYPNYIDLVSELQYEETHDKKVDPNKLTDGTFYGIFNGEDLVAYTRLLFFDKEQKDYAKISDFLVDKQYRHKHLGKSIFKPILSYIKDQKRSIAVLSVNYENIPAKKIYYSFNPRETMYVYKKELKYLKDPNIDTDNFFYNTPPKQMVNFVNRNKINYPEYFKVDMNDKYLYKEIDMNLISAGVLDGGKIIKDALILKHPFAVNQEEFISLLKMGSNMDQFKDRKMFFIWITPKNIYKTLLDELFEINSIALEIDL